MTALARLIASSASRSISAPADSPDGVSYRLDSPFGPLEFAAASMGNPHALLQVGNVEKAKVEEIGAFLGSQPVFPEGCNIGFAQVIDRSLEFGCSI